MKAPNREDDFAVVEWNLRIARGRHSPTCALTVLRVGGYTLLYPIGATCDCGRDALDRLVVGVYPEPDLAPADDP